MTFRNGCEGSSRTFPWLKIHLTAGQYDQKSSGINDKSLTQQGKNMNLINNEVLVNVIEKIYNDLYNKIEIKNSVNVTECKITRSNKGVWLIEAQYASERRGIIETAWLCDCQDIDLLRIGLFSQLLKLANTGWKTVRYWVNE